MKDPEHDAHGDDEFRRFIEREGDVRPLKQRRRAQAESGEDLSSRLRRKRHQETAEILQQAWLGDVPADDFNTGDEQEFRRDSLPRKVLRQLRRGEFTVQATLDVHGMRREEAHAATQNFLESARDRRWRCVKIIHGKGLHSPQGIPVLKARVDISLRRHNDVLAYCSAPNWAGGHGATLVLLRR